MREAARSCIPPLPCNHFNTHLRSRATTSSQVALGDKPKPGPHVVFVGNSEGKRFAIGTLEAGRCNQFTCDLTFAMDKVGAGVPSWALRAAQACRLVARGTKCVWVDALVPFREVVTAGPCAVPRVPLLTVPRGNAANTVCLRPGLGCTPPLLCAPLQVTLSHSGGSDVHFTGYRVEHLLPGSEDEDGYYSEWVGWQWGATSVQPVLTRALSDRSTHPSLPLAHLAVGSDEEGSEEEGE